MTSGAMVDSSRKHQEEQFLGTKSIIQTVEYAQGGEVSPQTSRFGTVCETETVNDTHSSSLRRVKWLKLVCRCSCPEVTAVQYRVQTWALYNCSLCPGEKYRFALFRTPSFWTPACPCLPSGYGTGRRWRCRHPRSQYSLRW